MFEDSTFDARSAVPDAAPKWMLLTLAVNLTLVGAAIVLPLVYPEALPSQLLHRILYVPPVEKVVVRTNTATAAASAASSTQAVRVLQVNLDTPRLTGMARPVAGDGPVADGPIDLSGGAGNGDVAGSGVFRGSSAGPVVKAAVPRVIPVSSGVLEGMRVSWTQPVYPTIARSAHVSGTVELAATISAAGRIENLQVLSGHPMLREAAIEAVKTWRYKPYLLNGQPVAVETTIRVVFRLGE